LSASIQGGATPAFRSTRNPSARSPAAVVRKLVQAALLHRLAHLPLDDRLPGWANRDLALGVAPLRHHMGNRSRSVTGKLTLPAGIVEATCN
jgi:hypothetical protein